jgi:RNA polymerase sigma-70 factor, ECF subfamily
MADAVELTELLAATARGDARAFERLYQASAPHLFALLLRMLKRRDWAEEALQDCFVKIWQKGQTYAPDKGAPLTWLLAVARYRALDQLRAKRPEVIEADEPAEVSSLAAAVADDDVPGQAATGQALGRLADCLRALPPEQRRSVLLSYYEGFTHAELAQRLATPLGTVKSWVRRGLLQLRECLAP